jgi:hypothetical protein
MSQNKILFYLEPWIELSFKADDYRCKFIFYLFSALPAKLPDFQIHFLISDFHFLSLPSSTHDKIVFHIIELQKLYGIFQLQSNYDYHHFTSEMSALEADYIAYLQTLNLPENIDIIYSISSNLHYLNKIYKGIPKLFLESGAINGYMGIATMLYLDPFTHNKGDSFLNQYYNQLITQEILNIETVKRVQSVMQAESNSTFVSPLRKDYRNIYLLAVENFDSALGKLYFTRHNVVDYIADIVSKIPKNSAIIITQHKKYKFVTPSIIMYLEQFGAKIIFNEKLTSNQVLPHVDGLISCFSTLILNAIILEKPVFITSKKSYLWKYSDCTTLEDFTIFVENRNIPHKNKLAAFAFLIEKYYMNYQQLENCNNYLKEVISYHSKYGAIDFNFYKSQSMAVMYVKNRKLRLIKTKVKNLARWIFSIFKQRTFLHTK